jgi:hypothetical protein
MIYCLLLGFWKRNNANIIFTICSTLENIDKLGIKIQTPIYTANAGYTSYIVAVVLVSAWVKRAEVLGLDIRSICTCTLWSYGP